MPSNELNLQKEPKSIEAEQSVLGALIAKPKESFVIIGNMLSPDDFYLDDHKIIFAVMQEMEEKNHDIDLVTLIDEVVARGVKDKDSLIAYLQKIVGFVPSISNVFDYAKIVHDKSILRKVINTCDEVSTMALSEEGKVEEIVDQAEQKFFDIAQQREMKEFYKIGDLLKEAYQEFTKKSKKDNKEEKVKTGFSDLDKILIELNPGDFVLVGARPGMGKTAFCLNVATNIAKHSNKAVCIFSLEMSALQIVNRMISSEAAIESEILRTGNFQPEDWVKISDAVSSLSEANILIDDTTNINVLQMKSKLRRVSNLGLVVIDYLGLMQSNRKIENRTQEITEITRNLKIMAKELKVPIICAAQLSRGTETRGGDHRPQLSDLRDSGSIEQDADMVLFLYRKAYYSNGNTEEQEKVDDLNKAEVIIAKNRHGSVGSVDMGWIGKYTKYITLDKTPYGSSQ